MFKKKFKSYKEAQLFKKEYLNGTIHTEVVSYILQPFHEEKFPEIKDYIHFLYNDSMDSRKIQGLRMYCESFALDILKHLYGKCDFTFNGNRTYKNYVFEFNGLTFITPSKREVVISSNWKDWKEHIPIIIQFEKTFQQFLFTHVLKNFQELPAYIQKDLLDLKNKGIISEDNQIDFNYFASKTFKPKI
jgi:hypothetical protein